MSPLAWLVASDAGDPDTWPEAVTWVGLGLCALGAYFVWCRWGGGARERDHERRYDDRTDHVLKGDDDRG